MAITGNSNITLLEELQRLLAKKNIEELTADEMIRECDRKMSAYMNE